MQHLCSWHTKKDTFYHKLYTIGHFRVVFAARFQSKVKCKTVNMKMSFIYKYKGLFTRPHFEEEA